MVEHDVDQTADNEEEGAIVRGRPRNSKYLSYEEARDFIRGEMIPSRSKYQLWWDANKPQTLPRFPYRVYQNEWQGWNEFLGTDNKFNQKIGTKWRTVAEAVSFVHPLQIKTKVQWMDWCKVPGNLPKDIPARPDLVYEKWTSWSHWLGNKPVAAIQAKQEAARVQVYGIYRNTSDHTTPQNVLLFNVEPTLGSAKERWKSGEEIVKLFWYDPTKAGTIKLIVQALSSPYMDDEKIRLVPNVWEVIYQLQMHLSVVTPADAARV